MIWKNPKLGSGTIEKLIMLDVQNLIEGLQGMIIVYRALGAKLMSVWIDILNIKTGHFLKP